MDRTSIRQAAERLRAAQRVLVVCHIRPDGDAIGSLIGLGLALQAAGKEVQMVCADGVPGSFHHLKGSRQVVGRPSGDFDACCVVDCSDLKRTGGVLDNLPQPDLNIDHHITNLAFAQINLVDPQAVSTTQILASLLPEFGLPVNEAVAAALLTGLVTDTIGFRTQNTTPAALRLAADLMERGANLSELYYRGLVGRSFAAARLWAAGLSRLQKDDRIAWCTLTREDRKAAGYPGKDDADLINILSSIEGIDIAIVIVEQSRSRVKVSWRAQPGIDVAQIALRFGGGGHPAAAGAELNLPIDEAVPLILEATQEALPQPEALPDGQAEITII
jgi:bifunctional oligoribonuclease and PAP phosphatase NrnA